MAADRSRTWALLVASHHGSPTTARMSMKARELESRQLLNRAAAVAPPEQTCALIAPAFLGVWESSAAELPRHNVLTQSPDGPLMLDLARAVRAIRARDAGANVIVIPANHCAAVESAWVISAQAAAHLATNHPNTVYLLHDKPRTTNAFDAELHLCSTTVVIGSADSIIELCCGSRETIILDLMAEDFVDSLTRGPATREASAERVICIVHVGSVDEYAKIQRGHYGRSHMPLVDVTA